VTETLNQLATQLPALSWFFATVGLALVGIGVTKQLVKDATARGYRPGGTPLTWDLHLLAFLFIFCPVVMWPLIAVPAAAAIPAALALGISASACWRAPTRDRPRAFVVVLSSTGMWICYGLYEDLTGHGRRRPDLAIVAPLLYYSSLLLWRFARRNYAPESGNSRVR
jgi:hypothetical protein